MIIKKNCKHCKKEFIAIRPNQKYCCKTCRFEAYEIKALEKKKPNGRRYNPKTGQLCWRCRNATDMNKCPWSIGILPEGCVAKKVEIKNEGIDTYKIISCPLFKEDED